MYFKINDLTMELGNTQIENIFINDFMPSANGDFVKVYIMGYKLACDSNGFKKFDSDIIANLLGLLSSDVLKAWDYWEKTGIIKKEYIENSDDYNIEFINLKEMYINNIYKVPDEKDDDIISILDNKEIASLLTKVDFYLRRATSPSEKLKIAKWIEIYNMPPSLIEEAFFYTTEIKKIYTTNSIKFAESVVMNWSIENIRTKEDIEKSKFEHDEKFIRFLKIKKRIGLKNKTFSDTDYKIVNSWFDVLEINNELISEALNKTARLERPNFAYTDKILKEWKREGINTIDDLNKLSKNTANKKTGFNNYKQVTNSLSSEDFEKLAKQKRDKLFKRLDK